jgi:hypothetical protein
MLQDMIKLSKAPSPAKPAIVADLEAVLEKYPNFTESFLGCFVGTQFDRLLHGSHRPWDIRLVHFATTIQFYGSQRVINILRGKGFQGKKQKESIEYDLDAIHLLLPPNSVIDAHLPKVDPYAFLMPASQL